MKRFFAVMLALALTVGMFAGCDGDGTAANEWSGEYGPHGIRYAADQTLRRLYAAEVTRLSPFNNSDSQNDSEFNALGTKGLVSRDNYNIVMPALAHSWDISECGTVYTFYLREGLVYVDHTMTPVPGSELTADCFVAVMEWNLNPEHLSPNARNWNDYVVGALEYYTWESGDEAAIERLGLTEEVTLDEIGFKAIDKHTLEITLRFPVPFFLEYTPYYPAWRPFLEEQGVLYGTDLDRIIFIGPYVLTVFEPQYRRVYTKNPYYYNADGIFVERIIDTYNSEAGLLAPVIFMNNEIDYAVINAEIVDTWLDNPLFAPYVCSGRPDPSFIWYYMFNFWPQFDEEYEPANWDLAVNNEAFRQSILWGLDTYRALLTTDAFNAHAYLGSTLTPVGYSVLGNVDYVDLPPLEDFAHHPTWLYDSDKALAYRDQAIAELTAQGATFPIKMLMPYNPSGSLGVAWALEVQVVAQQLQGLLGADYIEPIIVVGPATNFLADVRRMGNYAFMKGNNGEVAHGDPQSWTWAFEPSTELRNVNWNFIDLATGAETQRVYSEWVELLEAAMAIRIKSEERYLAFAEAEAHLIRHALVIPYYQTGGGYYAYRYNPFDAYGQGGQPSWRFEGLRVLAEPLTSEQWELLYADWLAEREEALANR
ncbi:MAG: ABC transporter substrate-binding protein [Defluviitaleaceae bacterium]|nr:ABC transporter substrate-binding protein [Defluviitaleaceae bacterium]MCL2836406.1 ABC transporter substrate-binding protein [Defluviitaleaceae bacterium]